MTIVFLKAVGVLIFLMWEFPLRNLKLNDHQWGWGTRSVHVMLTANLKGISSILLAACERLSVFLFTPVTLQRLSTNEQWLYFSLKELTILKFFPCCSFSRFLFALEICGAAPYEQIFHWKMEKSNSTISHDHVLDCVPGAHLSDRDMKQDHQKNDLSGQNLKMKRPFSSPPFIPPPTYPHEGADLHNETIIVYLLLSSASEG